MTNHLSLVKSDPRHLIAIYSRINGDVKSLAAEFRDLKRVTRKYTPFNRRPKLSLVFNDTPEIQVPGELRSISEREEVELAIEKIKSGEISPKFIRRPDDSLWINFEIQVDETESQLKEVK